ncbi:hypothetical protein ECG_05327 [Echinococcus granulosus]|nr:hypothetical protein ECG_05327 [Echinococcus granulosus]
MFRPNTYNGHHQPIPTARRTRRRKKEATLTNNIVVTQRHVFFFGCGQAVCQEDARSVYVTPVQVTRRQSKGSSARWHSVDHFLRSCETLTFHLGRLEETGEHGVIGAAASSSSNERDDDDEDAATIVDQ